jgi:anti-sigma regulatory factor (Ser/Thr protein kinase)
VVAFFQPSTQENWDSLSFVSTLYLCPVLDRLMAQVPKRWKAEVRLGLQEALVNAVKHGNNLDPSKTISVQYRSTGSRYWWVIRDEGGGFDFHQCCDTEIDHIEDCNSECGRGLYILHQIFDEVRWAQEGRELHLCKHIHRWFNLPQVS